MALPFWQGVGKVGAEVGTTALLSNQGGFSYQAAGQYQVAELIGGAVGRWGYAFLPGSQCFSRLCQAFPVADDAYFVPEQLL